MASSSKRLTRKDLRQPDWFQVASEAAIAFYNKRHQQVWIAVGGVLLVVAVAVGLKIFQARQNTLAGQTFGSAVSLYQDGKYREAIEGFQKAQDYRWSSYASIAYLYEANARLALNELDGAIVAAQHFIGTTETNSLYRQLGLFTLAATEERKQQYKSAAEHYSQAENINGPLKTLAILGKARCSENLGDYKTALTVYREHLKNNPESWVSIRIRELESKVSQQPAEN